MPTAFATIVAAASAIAAERNPKLAARRSAPAATSADNPYRLRRWASHMNAASGDNYKSNL